MTQEYAHAYILEGKSGETRDEYIRSFAGNIICPNADEFGHACGRCPACVRVRSGTHEDLFYMNQSGKDLYRVEDAADMMERLSMRPYGEHNVGVVDNAERLSEIVQNKLLKTLEEPYPGTVIILATDNRESLLPTVRSRCVIKHVFSDGEEAEDRVNIQSLLSSWNSKTYFFKVRELIKKDLNGNEDALAFLDVLETDLHDRLIGAGALPQDAVRLLNEIDEVEQTRINIKRGMNPDYALEALFLTTSHGQP